MPKETVRMDTVWGWRGVLGFICPSLYGALPDRGNYEIAPEGIAILASSLGINVVCPANLEEALTRVDHAAMAMADGGADFIHLAGPFGTLMPAADIVKRIENVAKRPASTGIGDQIAALKTLAVKKICHVHPGHFREDYDHLFRKLYKDNDIEVVNFKGLETPQTNNDVRRLPLYIPYELALKAYLEAPQADAIYIDCGAWGSPLLIDRLEEETGKPVITHPQMFLWAGLKALKVKTPVKGYGKIFETLL